METTNWWPFRIQPKNSELFLSSFQGEFNDDEVDPRKANEPPEAPVPEDLDIPDDLNLDGGNMDDENDEGGPENQGLSPMKFPFNNHRCTCVTSLKQHYISP